jgi:hypothetical protein
LKLYSTKILQCYNVTVLYNLNIEIFETNFMKPNRDASELAARLGSAMAKPPPLPSNDTERSEAAQPSTPNFLAIKPDAEPNTTRRGRPPIDTKGITLRPTKELLTRYTLAAADRTRTEGRVISAQEIMLEQLERGP